MQSLKKIFIITSTILLVLIIAFVIYAIIYEKKYNTTEKTRTKKVEVEKKCENDEDCKGYKAKCDYRRESECEEAGGRWVSYFSCASLNCPAPPPPECKCDTVCIDSICKVDDSI